MTDCKTYIEMLRRAGIAFETERFGSDAVLVRTEGGYAGFYCEHRFNSDGELESVESFE